MAKKLKMAALIFQTNEKRINMITLTLLLTAIGTANSQVNINFYLKTDAHLNRLLEYPRLTLKCELFKSRTPVH